MCTKKIALAAPKIIILTCLIALSACSSNTTSTPSTTQGLVNPNNLSSQTPQYPQNLIPQNNNNSSAPGSIGNQNQYNQNAHQVRPELSPPAFYIMHFEGSGIDYTLKLTQDQSIAIIEVALLDDKLVKKRVALTTQNSNGLNAAVQTLMFGKIQVNRGPYEEAKNQNPNRVTFTSNLDGSVICIVNPIIAAGEHEQLFNQIYSFLVAHLSAAPAQSNPSTINVDDQSPADGSKNPAATTEPKKDDAKETAPVPAKTISCSELNFQGSWKSTSTEGTIVSDRNFQSENASGVQYGGLDTKHINSTNLNETTYLTYVYSPSSCILTQTSSLQVQVSMKVNKITGVSPKLTVEYFMCKDVACTSLILDAATTAPVPFIEIQQ